jgi:hypothetical protein
MVTALARKKFRVTGLQSLVDVAQLACGDVRLAALLQDLNPALAMTGALRAGTVVVCPGKLEAQAFAKKMGFTLGFDPRAPNGSDARRKWTRHVGPAHAAPLVDALALARTLLARGMSPAEAGRRLAKQCSETGVAALLSSPDETLQQVGTHAEVHALYPRAASRMAAVRSVLDATLRPGGLLSLLEALARFPVDGVAMLQACAVAPALRMALVEAAARAQLLIERARALAALERGARDATLNADGDAQGIRSLVDAIVDGVDVLGSARIAAAGIEAEADALLSHVDMLRGALKQAGAGLGRSSAEVIRAVARGGDGMKLPRPWPLLAGVCRDVGAAIDTAPATARDAGLGGIVKHHAAAATRAAPRSGVRVTVADLQVRAAVCARAVDEGDAFAERLAPVVVELFGLMRPPPAVDGGTAGARKARQRMAFDRAAAGQGAVAPAGVAAVVADVIERATLGGSAPAQRLGLAQRASLEEAARAMSAPLTIHRQPMSELGRALVVAAMALDREMGQGLSRPTGREAFVSAAKKHAGRVLSAASCLIGS